MIRLLHASWDRLGRRRTSLAVAVVVIVTVAALVILTMRPLAHPIAMASASPTLGAQVPSSAASESPFLSTSTPTPTNSTARPLPPTPPARGTTSTPTPPTRTPTPTPTRGAVQHVIWVWLENAEYGSVTPSSMPYLTTLARTYGMASNYYAIGHNSEMNYISALAGQHGSYTDGSVNIPYPSLWDQLAGGWRAYQQDIPSSCSLAGSFAGPRDGPGIAGTYVERHNPATVFRDVAAGGCLGHVLPMAAFNPAAAPFVFVTPNLCNDAHNSCGGSRLSNADRFLREFVPEVTTSGDFAHTILFITFDEGTTSAGQLGDRGGHIFTAAVAPWLSHVVSGLVFDHYSLLRTVEHVFGLPCLAEACTRQPMTAFLP